MNYKIILIILLILFLLGNYFRESFTETPTHYLLNSSTQPATFQLTNIISRSTSGDKEDDFKNLYNPFGNNFFKQDNDYEQGQLPILVLESYNECPTLHTLYKSLKKLKTGTEEEAGIGAGTVGTGTDAGTAGTGTGTDAGTGTVAKTDTKYEQNENVEGYRFRSLIQSVFYNITEPIEVDYKLFDMFVEDKFKEDLSNNQPNLKLKLSNIVNMTTEQNIYFHDYFTITLNVKITDVNELNKKDSSVKYFHFFEITNNKKIYIKISYHKEESIYVTFRSTPDWFLFKLKEPNLINNNNSIDVNIIINKTPKYLKVNIINNNDNTNYDTVKRDISNISKKIEYEPKLEKSLPNFSKIRNFNINKNPDNHIKIEYIKCKNSTILSYLDSEQPQYSFNHKEATFGVQENFERIDILRFMDFAFTTLCWGALHINLLKPLDNHFYAFPCQNSNCNTISNKPHFFYLLPVKVRQICYEEGSEYTRAKCNGCASNIIVFFNQVPNKFKNLSNINQIDQNKSITSTVLIT